MQGKSTAPAMTAGGQSSMAVELWFPFTLALRRGKRKKKYVTRKLRKEPTAAGFRAVVTSFTPALRELLVSDILIRFCERIPCAFVILWAMDHRGLDAQQFSYLVAIEMITAMLCYIPVAHLADKYGRRPFVLVTFMFFTLFPVTLLWAKNFFWLEVAFAVRGLKEFGEPARKRSSSARRHRHCGRASSPPIT